MKVYYLKDTPHPKTEGKIIKAGTISGMQKDKALELIKSGTVAEYPGGLVSGQNFLQEKQKAESEAKAKEDELKRQKRAKEAKKKKEIAAKAKGDILINNKNK